MLVFRSINLIVDCRITRVPILNNSLPIAIVPEICGSGQTLPSYDTKNGRTDRHNYVTTKCSHKQLLLIIIIPHGKIKG